MDIREAQRLVREHLERIGYTKIETSPSQTFLHLIEEVGEVSRALLHRETKRESLPVTTKPPDLRDEIADVFWQTLKLSSYLDIDLEEAFMEKYEKNKAKSKVK